MGRPPCSGRCGCLEGLLSACLPEFLEVWTGLMSAREVPSAVVPFM